MRTKGTDVVVVTAKEPMSCRQKVTPRSWKKRETGKLLQLLLLLLLQSGPKVGQGWNTTKEKRDFFKAKIRFGLDLDPPKQLLSLFWPKGF